MISPALPRRLLSPDWKSGMPVPTDIAIAYLIQGSFYGHSIYATIYMDAWRKDSAVMVVHHIITLALICFSYAFRYSFFLTGQRSERAEHAAHVWNGCCAEKETTHTKPHTVVFIF